jgi:hypothetical protein
MLNARRAGKAIRLLPLLLCVALSSCCQREVQARHPSPSGTKLLSIVRVNCAAFDSFQTEIRLEGSDASRGQVVATINRSPVVQVTWVDDTSVLVFAPRGHNIAVQKKEVDGVRIEFR